MYSLPADKMFNHYDQGADAACDLLPRLFGKYGDNSGTRTFKKTASAEKKIEYYFTKLGSILSH